MRKGPIHRIAFCLAAAIWIFAVSGLARAQGQDENSAASRGISRIVPIPLPCPLNPVPHFDKSDENAIIATASAPYGADRVYVVTLGEVTNLITRDLSGKTAKGRPLIVQKLIPVKDNTTNQSSTIIAARSDVLQRIAFLRANLDPRSDRNEVILVAANRIAENPERPSPVDLMVYRLHEDPIIDGEIVYFAPALSWQSAGTYLTATEALETAFAIKLTPDGDGSCSR